MASLADKAILSGAENRPPMLEKDMYDSWRNRMEMYMLNRQHGRIILESVEHGPLFWPSVTEDGVTRLKKYYEFNQYYSSSTSSGDLCISQYAQGGYGFMGTDSDTNARHIVD
nr:Gag-Pol polyprotein [Tanacetum cinerariifolium]